MRSGRTGPTHNKVVVCYISACAVYRPGRGSYSIENFDPNLCTHVVYAFAGLDITQDAIKSLDPWQDLRENHGQGGFERINALKRSHPHLKVSLAIGGWNEGSTNYSNMAADRNRRRRFVQQVSAFIRQHNFDGLDLDWEFPTQRGGNQGDRDTFVQLVRELREEFNRHNLLLTSAFSASKAIIDQAYNVRELARYLDYLHIMCYDYHGSWDRRVGPSAPLRDDGVFSVKYTIDYMLQLGCPASKLVMGVPFYGRTFKTAMNGYFGDDAYDAGFQGPYTREDGFVGYNEICELLRSGWSKSWDARTAQAIARFRDQGVTKVVTYDSSRSIANKVRFAMQKNLAGVMVWSVDTDDFRGDYELDTDTFIDFDHSVRIPRRMNSKYPLLRTINEGIVLALNEMN